MLYVDIKKKLSGFNLDVKLDITAGRLGLLGASGSGKSMTLKSIAGIETPDEGMIVLNDRILFDSQKKINLPVRERNVGYLFQNYALFPHMTALQNIISGMKGMSKKDKLDEAMRLIENLHLKGLEDRYPKALSGGQQQRVAIGRMLAAKPEILLFDEPFSALDYYLRRQMQEQLLELLHEKKLTSLIVSHDIDEAYCLCDTIAIVNNGCIEITDTKENIFNKPRKLSAAYLTGCANISKVKKLSDTKIFAIDWGIELEIVETTGPIHYVGIRSHHMHLTKDRGSNTFNFKIKSINENRFDDTIMFYLKEESPNNNEKALRLDLSKDKGDSLIDSSQKIKLPKHKLLLLTE